MRWSGPPARALIRLLPVVLVVGAGCAIGSSAATSEGALPVVAAEDVWGSIAAQLGGSRVTVASLVTNPNTDPHSYEPTVADARAMAGARLVIVNGVGYDPWAGQLLAANPVGGRVVLTVGRLVGIPPGGNPHRWYDPADVERVIAAITADYQRLDPADAGYFATRRAGFESRALQPYHRLIGTIRARFAGTAIGASESLVVPLAQALGLRLLTPASFLNAVSEGAEPTVADEQTIAAQIRARQIRVYVYNPQNVTPNIQAQTASARAVGIPVTTLTETLIPATATFQDWQVRELRDLLQALTEATHR